ncbi:MAG: tetraacyldisaccharide 4'-kinase [Gammaproteobacteria bacterium]|nr:tetraacyldisaccharide 4'-kinase [Gammaproteobacteria bacterium]
MTTKIEAWLQGVWYRGQPGAALLAPLSAIFALVTRVRRALYRSGLIGAYRARIPVVVIGNLSVGGTGKSPLVAALASALKSRGLRPGILTRGHGVLVCEPTRVTRDADPGAVGDEPLMLAIATGVEVMVSPDRAAGARALEALGVDLILCDDGLQHYALARDLEVVVIDAARGLGNGRLLPAGPLREDVSRLESVDWVVVNGAVDGDTASGPWRGRRGRLAMMLVPEALRGIADPLRWCSLEGLRAEPVHAVAGIGHPARFFAMLRAAGLEVIEHAFVDHHAFAMGDLDFGDTRAILMTSKDAVKCRRFADARCWEVPVVARFSPDGAANIMTAIEKLCLSRRL